MNANVSGDIVRRIPPASTARPTIATAVLDGICVARSSRGWNAR